MKKSRESLMLASSGISLLENEWAKYKYLILGRDPNAYNAIRVLLKDKSRYPSKEFFSIIDAALSLPENIGYEVNAAQHVAGYFKKVWTQDENKSVQKNISDYNKGRIRLKVVKKALYDLAVKYEIKYLLGGYYFDII